MMTTDAENAYLLERVAALEEAVKHLITKDDLERVRVELLAAIAGVQVDGRNHWKSSTIWTVGTTIVTGVLAVAAIKLL